MKVIFAKPLNHFLEWTFPLWLLCNSICKSSHIYFPLTAFHCKTTLVFNLQPQISPCLSADHVTRAQTAQETARQNISNHSSWFLRSFISWALSREPKPPSTAQAKPFSNHPQQLLPSVSRYRSCFTSLWMSWDPLNVHLRAAANSWRHFRFPDVSWSPAAKPTVRSVFCAQFRRSAETQKYLQ